MLIKSNVVFELLFLFEIVQNFLTAIKDKETLESIYSLRPIAIEYVVRGKFIIHLLAFLPLDLLYTIYGMEDDQWHNTKRDLKCLKLFRILRVGSELVPVNSILSAFHFCTRKSSRQYRISSARVVKNILTILKVVLATLGVVYITGLLWFRFSDRWQTYFFKIDDQSNYFVVRFGLRTMEHYLEPSSSN